MSQINRDDLKIIFRFALHIARVDESFVGLEKNVLGHYIAAMHLREGEKAEMVQQGGSLSEGLEHLSSPEAKVLLVKTLCAMAGADGVMHEKEVGFIQKVNTQLGDLVSLGPWEEWSAYEQEVLDALQSVS